LNDTTLKKLQSFITILQTNSSSSECC
jgi:hypothetical protein